MNREFAPFVLFRKYPGHTDDVTSINWSADSTSFLSASKDMSCRLQRVDKSENVALTGHRDVVIAAFFSLDGATMYSVSRDGAVLEWKKIQLDDGRIKWSTINRHYFNMANTHVSSAHFHPKANLLLVGFDSGIFGLWEMPEFANIHTLSVSQYRLSTVTMNATGEWLALGSSKLGQLVVWEWQSESFILKQQGHYNSLNSLAYSHDGQHIVTGGEDGKVKLWNTRSGFCFVTFTEHTGSVTAVDFTKNSQVVVTASLDGTVRAFDLVRYRNFRTFVSPEPNQFSSLAVDPSGDVVCAGSRDNFEIFVWSMQTGKALDVLAGHEGPISALAFSPDGSTLASGSWDYSVRTWDLFSRGRASETLKHTSEVISIAYRPDGKHLAVATANGEIAFWQVDNSAQLGIIEGQPDLSGGRKHGDHIAAKTTGKSLHFTSISYSSDGSCLLACGNSKWICLYDVENRVLLKKFQVSRNLSYDGVQEMLNSRRMTDAGPIQLLDVSDSDDSMEDEDKKRKRIPGVKSGDLALRTVRPHVQASCVRFTPTGRAWAAAATEGLLIYSLDSELFAQFDPFELDMDLTPKNVLHALNHGHHAQALGMALRLDDPYLAAKCFHAVQASDIGLCVRTMPIKLLERLLQLVTSQMEKSGRIEFCLMWALNLLQIHAEAMRHAHVDYGSGIQAALRNLRKEVAQVQQALAKMSDENLHLMDYLSFVQTVEQDVQAMSLD
jgi:periodic tryptophan protein 2